VSPGEPLRELQGGPRAPVEKPWVRETGVSTLSRVQAKYFYRYARCARSIKPGSNLKRIRRYSCFHQLKNSRLVNVILGVANFMKREKAGALQCCLAGWKAQEKLRTTHLRSASLLKITPKNQGNCGYFEVKRLAFWCVITILSLRLVFFPC